MKKVFLFLATTFFLFAFDLTFTKAFNNFNQGIKLLNTNPYLANQKFKKAYELIKKIKNKNSSQVYEMLGRMYANGWGVKKDYNLAIKYLLKAIKLGNKRAYCDLANIYIKLNKLNIAKKYINYVKFNKQLAETCNKNLTEY